MRCLRMRAVKQCICTGNSVPLAAYERRYSMPLLGVLELEDVPLCRRVPMF